MLSPALAAHRVRTFVGSWQAISRLTPKQVDDFMASYVIYNLDWADEPQMIRTLGPDYARKVGDCLVAYYSVLNHLCALGSVEKMYIPPNMRRGAGILQNVSTAIGFVPLPGCAIGSASRGQCSTDHNVQEAPQNPAGNRHDRRCRRRG